MHKADSQYHIKNHYYIRCGRRVLCIEILFRTRFGIVIQRGDDSLRATIFGGGDTPRQGGDSLRTTIFRDGDTTDKGTCPLVIA